MTESKSSTVGTPDPLRLYQALGRIYSEQYGVEIRLARLARKDTGEVIYDGREENSA